MTVPHGFLEALPSSYRASELSDEDDIFGFLIGSWELDAVLHGDNGETSAELIARRAGNDIAMEGKLRDDTAIRWKYTAITPTSFHYTAERSKPGDSSWRLYLELFGKR